MTESDLPSLKPTANRLLVHMRPGAQETRSGLIIPAAYQQITQNADVLGVGPDVKYVKPGDLVLVSIHAGTKICDKQNTPVLMITEEDIEAILE